MRSDLEQAVRLLKSGDPKAVDKAVALLQDSVFSFSMRVCGQRQDAEDTMQEVLIKSLPYLDKFDSPKALAVWLYKVARNRCLMSRRKGKFAPTRELSLDELMPDRRELERLGSEGPTPEAAAVRSEQGRKLREAIRTLPPHYRIVLVLRDMEGLSDDEVAEITGLRPGTIRVRLHRARLFIWKELTKQPRTGGKPQRKEEVQPRTRRCRKIFAGLSDYLDGELDDFSCEELETHMEHCEPCKKFLRSLESTIAKTQAAPAELLDRQRAANIRKKVLATYSRALAAGK